MTINNNITSPPLDANNNLISNVLWLTNCGKDIPACVVNSLFGKSKYAAYAGSNALLKLPFSATHFCAKQAIHGSNWLINLAASSLGASQLNLIDPARKLQGAACKALDQLSQFATECITPNANAIYEKRLEQYNKFHEIIDQSPPEKFNAISLIAPALLAGYCSRKSMENLSCAFHHLKLLATFKRKAVTTVVFNTPVNNTKGSTNFVQTIARNYTSTGLALDVLIETLIAGAWATGSYITYQSIFDALKTADPENAEWVAQAIFLAVSIGPSMVVGIKKITDYFKNNKEYHHFGTGPTIPEKAMTALKNLKISPKDLSHLNPYAPTKTQWNKGRDE